MQAIMIVRSARYMGYPSVGFSPQGDRLRKVGRMVRDLGVSSARCGVVERAEGELSISA